jgi:putative ABC transport system ATP-binding protein/lipoprotein-releasing system ATP-binding protein
MTEPAADSPLVNARDLARTFIRGSRTTEALRPTTWTIRPRVRIAIVGPSGSGKSTLLHLMAGLDMPSSGTIEWPALGRREELRPARVGVALQATTLIPFLSVLENVALPLLVLGQSTDRPRQAAAEALSLFGLRDLSDRLPDELSGGQAQRVALARALAARPSLVLADEPTGQLDQATGAATTEVLNRWAEVNGSALVVATHDLKIAERFDAVWRMDHGALFKNDRATP